MEKYDEPAEYLAILIQYVVRGVILLAAVIFDRWKQKAKRCGLNLNRAF
ncbi:hypothetical protein MJ588_18450 [Klebsiella pneumoniae]|nr:hypothetical protein MJ588_18450 [Klebsiella pneumoniae]